MKTIRKSKKRFIVVSTIAIMLLVAGTAANLWVWHTKTQELDAQDQAVQRSVEDALKEAQRIRAEKAEKERQRQIAAQELAERATRGDASAAGIDASVCNPSKVHNNPAEIDVVVNKKHCLRPLDYAPADLVTSNGATLSAKAMQAFNQMYAAAMADGQPFRVTSSYRSYADQVSTYAYWVSTSGKAEADTYSARPGYSEHQTGYVVDVAAGGCVLDCFGSTAQYNWFQQNAAQYGFIQRYYKGSESVTGYKAEEWHYRYVGVHVAQDMQAKGIKTLEEYWSIVGGDY